MPEAAVQARIVDVALPADGGARLFRSTRASRSASRPPARRPARPCRRCAYYDRLVVVVDRAGAHHDDQPRVHPGQLQRRCARGRFPPAPAPPRASTVRPAAAQARSAAARRRCAVVDACCPQILGQPVAARARADLVVVLPIVRTVRTQASARRERGLSGGGSRAGDACRAASCVSAHTSWRRPQAVCQHRDERSQRGTRAPTPAGERHRASAGAARRPRLGPPTNPGSACSAWPPTRRCADRR